MKKIFTAVIAAVALFSLASCQKMDRANNDSEKTIRVITGKFSNDGTKTTLGTDNKTPQWSVGDKIRVLNESSYQDITLTSSNIDSEDASKITFTTTLSGMLYAVYPASATAMTSCSGNITYTIPAVQDGTFGSANICVASGDGEKANSIYFSNATAVVEMSVATDVVGTQFAAANNIAGDMTVAMSNKGVMGTTTPSLSSKTISVSDTKAPAGNKFYLAVAPVDAGNVTVTCNTTTKSGSIDKGTKTLANNKIYAMNLSTMTINTDIDLTGQHGVLNGQEYVLIKAKYDGKNDSYLKWATQNLAVTESGKAKWMSTNYVIGDYFQWAASYAGYKITDSASQIPTNLVIYDSFKNTCAGESRNSFSLKTGKKFNKTCAPYGGTSYSKYNSGSATLASTDDVANIVLGSTWRMPTGGGTGEIKAMRDVTYWAWDTTDKGYYVFNPEVGTSGTAGGIGTLGQNDDKTKALLFFPAAGIVDVSSLNDAGEGGYYWSSTLNSGDTVSAYDLYFDPSFDVFPEDYSNRYYGFSVRPVSD